jgi:hypothetical protein
MKDEHRLIMEQHLGRKLRSNQIVHHINGDIKDNSVENLETMTRREHARFHLKGRKIPAEQCERMRIAHIGRPHYGVRRISNDQILHAIRLYGEGMTKRRIEEICNLSMGTIYGMFRGEYCRCQEFTKEMEEARANRALTEPSRPKRTRRVPSYGFRNR